MQSHSHATNAQHNRTMWWMAGTDRTHDAGRESARNKLRPLMPRHPISQFPPMQTHSNNILPNYTWNHHHPVSGFKRETHAHSVALVSTRWNPTPEQLQGLEELYRRGTRTPSAEQIQHIASRLRRFGKIEGKNVFYWFQNHKARERQKKRRQLETHSSGAGLSRRSYLDHKKLATPSNCTTPPQGESESMHGSVIAERKKDVWAQSNQKELQLDEITSWKLDSSHFNTTSTCPPGQENADPANDHDVVGETAAKQNRTLQLFPIRTDDWNNLGSHEDQSGERDDVSGVRLGDKSRLNHEFIEFLPTKKYM